MKFDEPEVEAQIDTRQRRAGDQRLVTRMADHSWAKALDRLSTIIVIPIALLLLGYLLNSLARDNDKRDALLHDASAAIVKVDRNQAVILNRLAHIEDDVNENARTIKTVEGRVIVLERSQVATPSSGGGFR